MVFDEKLLHILMDIRWWSIRKYRKLSRVLRNVRLSDLKESYSWAYDDIGLTSFPKISNLESPADRLTNFTVDEFAHADDLFLGWLKTKDIEYLKYLYSVLYTEVDTNGKRKEVDKELLDKLADKVKISRTSLMVVALVYQGCRSYIFNRFKIVFPKQKNPTKKIPQSSGFGKLVLHLSGQKFGTYNETRRTNIYTFLEELTEQFKQNKNG